MGLLNDLIAGAVGYGIASSQNSTVVGDIIDNNIKSMTLEDIIKNYAARHLDIYTTNNDFAYRLHQIARQYEDYNYSDIYPEY